VATEDDGSFAHTIPAPPKRPGPARLWLSPQGMLIVCAPFDRAAADMIAALPRTARSWSPADRVWRVTPDLLPRVREILAARFEAVEEDPAVAGYLQHLRTLRERARLDEVRREVAGTNVIDLDDVRRRVRGGAA